MYEVLAIAMKIEEYPQKEIDRVLLSQVDYTARNINSMLFSAAFLRRLESYQQALNLYRQASSLDSVRHEPYIKSLDLARKLKDSKVLQWATVGVMENAWRLKDHRKYEKQALSYVHEEIDNLKKQNKKDELKDFKNKIYEASIRDLDIELTWSGEGELDFFIEEPNGTICSHENPVTDSGGVYVKDGYGVKRENCFDKYVNRVAFSGDYVVRVKKIDIEGEIVGNRATLKIVKNKNSDHEVKSTHSVLIARKDSIIKLTLKSGRRKKRDLKK